MNSDIKFKITNIIDKRSVTKNELFKKIYKYILSIEKVEFLFDEKKVEFIKLKANEFEKLI